MLYFSVYLMRSKKVPRQSRASGCNTRSVILSTDSYESWVQTSARIAWIFWLADRRQSIPSDPASELADWQQVAPQYRARMRQCLRLLEKEDVGFRVGVAHESKDWSSPQGKELAVRIAWILWMMERRETATPDTAAEIEEWQRTAQTDKTSSAQRALSILASEGIALIREQ